MKTELKKIALVSFLAILDMNTLKAQNSDIIKVKDSKETIIIHDSPNVKPIQLALHDTLIKTAPPIIERKDETPPLHLLELGLRYMPTFSSMSFKNYNGDVIQGEATMSNGYGFMVGINSKHVGLQAEVDYLKVSQKYKDRNLDRVVDINYLNIPVLLSLNTDKSKMVNWNVVVGPQFGLNVGAKTTTNVGGGSADTLRAVVAVKKGDVGIAYGTGLEFMVNKIRTVRIDLGFRGFYGLIDMSTKSTKNDPNTYNVIVNASRKAYGGYLGLTFLF